MHKDFIHNFKIYKLITKSKASKFTRNSCMQNKYEGE